MTARRTSIEAYNYLKENNLLSPRRWEIYNIIYQHGPLTGGEIGRHMPEYRSAVSTADRNIHARLAELFAMDMVYESGERACSVTKRDVILWDVTDRKDPIKISKSKKAKCPHCKGTGEVQPCKHGNVGPCAECFHEFP